MTPLDFVCFDGDSSPNDPIHKVAEAMKNNLIIRDSKGEFRILSYYLNYGQMVLDIERI